MRFCTVTIDSSKQRRTRHTLKQAITARRCTVICTAGSVCAIQALGNMARHRASTSATAAIADRASNRKADASLLCAYAYKIRWYDTQQAITWPEVPGKAPTMTCRSPAQQGLIHNSRTCAGAAETQWQVICVQARAPEQRTALPMMRQALQLYAVIASALLLEVTAFCCLSGKK